MKIINKPEFAPKYVLFDFDGTISLIRAGWQEIMQSVCLEQLLKDAPKATEKPRAALQAEIDQFIGDLTGKETIYQMRALAELVEKYGGNAKRDLDYKKLYLDRLDQRNHSTLNALADGEILPDDKMVPGAREIIRAFDERGLTMYVASGTDEPNVRHEAYLLDTAHYFQGIYGADPVTGLGSKKDVIEMILKRVPASELVVFGDGPVEIEYGKQAGAYTVGLTLNEEKPDTDDTEKVKRLERVKPDVFIRTFDGEVETLMQLLFGV